MELLQPNKPMTRRKMLRTMAAAGATTMAGGAILAACNETQTQNQVQTITINFGDWPFAKLPTTATAKDLTDINTKTDVDLLKAFQKDHPNVSYKYVATKIDSGSKLAAAIAANTAPTFYGVPNGVNLSAQRAAVQLGYAADVSSIYESHKVDSVLADYALPVWKNLYNVNGKYYGLPGDLLWGGAGVVYRRDLWAKMGKADPKYDWTWQDFHDMAKAFSKNGQPAFQAPSYEAGWLVNSNLLDPGDNSAIDSGLLSSLPTNAAAGNNSWHWKVSVDPWMSEWEERIGLWRNMVFNEKIVAQGGTTYWEGSALQGLIAEQFNMAPAFAFFVTSGGFGAGSISDLAKKYNAPPSDIVAFLPYPHGSNGAFNPGINTTLNQIWVNPNANTATQDLFTSLWLYAWYGDGYINKYAARYAATKDAKQLYSYPVPANRFIQNPKVPNVTTEDAWGKPFIDVYKYIVGLPLLPGKGLYFPPDTQQGPNKAIHDDLLSQLTTTQDPVKGILKNFETQYNHLAGGQNSDLDGPTFQTAETNYLKALNDFFQANASTFYNGDWQKYYQLAQNGLAGK